MPCHLLRIDAVFPTTPPQKKKSFVEALTRNVMVSQGPLGGDSVVRPGRRSEGIRALIRRRPLPRDPDLHLHLQLSTSLPAPRGRWEKAVRGHGSKAATHTPGSGFSPDADHAGPRSWAPGLRNCEEISVCCLSRQPVVFFMAAGALSLTPATSHSPGAPRPCCRGLPYLPLHRISELVVHLPVSSARLRLLVGVGTTRD